jgi:hypothetical protein
LRIASGFKEEDRGSPETEAEVLAEAAVRMTNTLLRTGSAAPEPMAERVKRAVVQTESIKEAIADGNYERIQTKPLPKSSTPKALFNFLGTSVVITGTSLLQTTKVTFGGVGATAFTVNSDTTVTATVPTGAKTGKIAITTQGGTAQSAANFTVTP